MWLIELIKTIDHFQITVPATKLSAMTLDETVHYAQEQMIKLYPENKDLAKLYVDFLREEVGLSSNSIREILRGTPVNVKAFLLNKECFTRFSLWFFINYLCTPKLSDG